MSDDNKPKKDKVGYKNPPKHSQFKKGRSGNPKGRKKRLPPNKLRDPYEMLPGILAEQVTMTINGKQRTLPIMDAMWLSTGLKAAGGNLGATKMILEMIKQAPPALTDPKVFTIRYTDEDRKMMDLFLEQAESYGADPDKIEGIKRNSRFYQLFETDDDDQEQQPTSLPSREH